MFSDSHAGRQFMRRCVKAIRPDALVHLGDYYEDGQVLADENPHLVTHRVPGNCDQYRCPPDAAAILCYPVGGARLYMTHGHIHHVKYGTAALLRDARKQNAQAVLYGHTHRAECYQEADGLWVMNPGACGSDSGSAGVIETQNGIIRKCYLIRQEDLGE